MQSAMLKSVVCLLALVACTVAEGPVSYDGYKTYRLVPQDLNQLNLLRSLNEELNLDFWSNSRKPGKNVDVMVDPETQSSFEQFLANNKIDSSVLIENVQTTIDRENEDMRRNAPIDGKISFTQFNRYNVIVEYLEGLANDYPNLVTLYTIGRTVEGREIKGIVVSSANGGSTNRPGFLIEGGIHAREWIAPSTILYLINELVANSAANKALLDQVDWFIVPVSNPDGYEYTHTNDRLWRKNRGPGNAICKGTDPNRNFGYHYGGLGTSTSPCSETYKGTGAFSEKESSALRDFAAQFNGGEKIKAYLAMHSYGPYLLYPWGYDEILADDWRDLDDLAQNAIKALTAVRGTEYEIGNSAGLLYPAAGGSDDYMKGGQGIKYAYTMELPGGGSDGFNPPPSAIQPVGKETFEAYKVFAKTISAIKENKQ